MYYCLFPRTNLADKDYGSHFLGMDRNSTHRTLDFLSVFYTKMSFKILKFSNRPSSVDMRKAKLTTQELRTFPI
jgi:hypothetical protein